MSWLLDALTREYGRADKLQRSHDTEYDGTSYVTPSLIDHDDGKEAPHAHGNHENPFTQA